MRYFSYLTQKLSIFLKAGTKMPSDIAFLEQTFQIVQDQEYPRLVQMLQKEAKALFQKRRVWLPSGRHMQFLGQAQGLGLRTQEHLRHSSSSVSHEGRHVASGR